MPMPTARSRTPAPRPYPRGSVAGMLPTVSLVAAYLFVLRVGLSVYSLFFLQVLQYRKPERESACAICLDEFPDGAVQVNLCY